MSRFNVRIRPALLLAAIGIGCAAAEPAARLMKLPSGSSVVLEGQASPEDVMRLSLLLGAQRELLSVRATGAVYIIDYRFGRCEHLVRLRREGELFLLAPYDREVRACP